MGVFYTKGIDLWVEIYAFALGKEPKRISFIFGRFPDNAG